MDDLREQLLALQVRRSALIWGDSDLTDPAVVADLADVQQQISRLMTSYEARSLVAETRQASGARNLSQTGRPSKDTAST